MLTKKSNHIRRKKRIRFRIKGNSSNRLRLCFYTSSKYIYTQVIDDNKNITLTTLATHSKDFKDLRSKNNIEAAKILGAKVGELLLENKHQDVFFDRCGCKYHGKAKAFAESARKTGLNF